MSEHPDSGWLDSSNEARRLLYSAIKRLIDLRQIGWHAFYAGALDRQPSSDYHDNFRKGINSRKNCAQMYSFLRQNFPETADYLDSQLEPIAFQDPWARCLREHSEGESLCVVAGTKGQAPQYQSPPGFHLIYHGEPHYLHLDSRINGSAVCLRGVAGYWTFVPLGSSGTVAVDEGRQWLSVHADGFTPSPLIIQDVYHRADYVAVVGCPDRIEHMATLWPRDFPLRDRHLDKLAKAITAHPQEWMVARVNFGLLGPNS